MTRPSSLADLASIFDSQPISGTRNRIINGNFEIWQRGTTSRTQGAAGVYGADRWTRMGFQDAAHERVSISSPPTGLNSRFALRASSSTTAEVAGGTRIDLSQKIENVNCYDLSNQTVTLSFWVRFSSATATSSTGTAFGNWVSFFQFNTSTTDSATSSDTGNSGTTANTITNGSLPTTWTKYTAIATVPSGTNNISIRFQFQGLGSTASAGTVWYEISEVQLEAGPFATPFERRHFGQELMLCQRYFERWDGSGSDIIGPVGQAFGSTSGETTIIYVVEKRAAPVVTTSGSFAVWIGSGNANHTSMAFVELRTRQLTWQYGGASAGSVGQAIQFYALGAPAALLISAEL